MENDPQSSRSMDDPDFPDAHADLPFPSREKFESITTPNNKSRRRVLGIVALGSMAAVGAGSMTAPGRRFLRKARGRVRTLADRLEDRWHSSRSASAPSFSRTEEPLQLETEYRAFLSKIPLRYIKTEEIIHPHRNIRNGVANTIPPRHMWDRIVETLKVADEIRHRLGKPLYCINSAYRSPAYNAECAGAASKSYHMQNRALDLMFRGGPEAAAQVARKLRDDEFFSGGIGIYPTFIHVDTRGYNASWEA